VKINRVATSGPGIPAAIQGRMPEGAPGQRAVFPVTLPLAASLAPAADAAAVDVPPPREGKSILVVDDEPTIVSLLGDLLTLDGHRVDGAANGRLALDRLGEHAYDLVMTDVRMPELDGPGLYREMERRCPELRRRVIFITGDTLSASVRRFLDETGMPCLTKPFALDTVVDTVRNALRAVHEGWS